MVKKLIKIGLCLILCFLQFSALQLDASAALTGNLLIDPGFEENSDKWMWPSGAERTAEKARSGTYAALLTYPGSSNARVVQEFSGSDLQTGATYELRFWMWTNDDETVPKVRLTYTGGDVSFTEPAFSPMVGKWTEGVYTFTPSPGVTKVNISFRLYGGTVLYYDDVSLVKTKSGNLFTNGDFEDNTSEAWIKVNGAEYSDEKAHSGNFSIRLDKSDSRVTQSLYAKNGIVQGATYELRVWTYALSENVRPRIKLQFGGADKEESRDLTYKVNTWTENVHTFQVPLGTTRVDVLLRLYEDGVLYYDDASLEMIKPADRVMFSTNEIFYYTDLTEGYINLDVNKNVYTSYGNFAADVVIKDEKGTGLITKHDQSLASGSAEIPFDLTRLPISDKPYTVKCTIRDGTIELEQKEETIYRKYPRPKYLTKDGTFEINGEPFHPVFGYHIDHKKYNAVYDAETGATLLEVVKAHGVNVVQLPAGLILPHLIETLVVRLDTLWEHGMYGFVCLYPKEYPAGSEVILPNDTHSTADYVRDMLKYTYVQDGQTKRLIDHPAIFAWGVADEPLSGGFTEKELFDSYVLLRDADPVHPLFDTENATGFFERSIKYVDILGMDDYPYSQSKSIYHIEDSTEFGEGFANKSGKATLPVLQFFNRNEDGSAPQSDYFPSGDEMRNMIYQSFFAGAPALGYFAFDAMQDGKWVMFTDTGKAIQSFAGEEQRLMFDLFTSGKYEKEAEVETANGAYVRFSSGEKIYIAVRSKILSGNVTLPIETGREKPCILHSTKGIATESVLPGDGSFSVTLSPAGTAILELTELEDLVFTDGEAPITTFSSGDTVHIEYYGEEEDVALTIALYGQSDTGTEMLDIQFFSEGGGEYIVPAGVRKGYSLRAFAWKKGKILPIFALATITVK